MEPGSEPETIAGLTQENYVKITYILVMVSAVLAAFSSILFALGVFLVGSKISFILGMSGVVLAMLGINYFTEKFNEAALSHLKFIAASFAVFFVVGLFVATVLGSIGLMFLLHLFSFAFNAVWFVLLNAGLLVWKRQGLVTPNVIKAELISFFGKDEGESKGE